MATQFIDKSKDFKGYLSARILAKLNDAEDDELINAEAQAIGMITDATGATYDIAAELAKTGTERNKTLIRWLAVVCTFLMYGSAADIDVPERVIKNYDDVREELRLINQGKSSVMLDRLQVDGEAATKFRWGSDARRSHNPF